jgi:hypothetical protein
VNRLRQIPDRSCSNDIQNGAPPKAAILTLSEAEGDESQYFVCTAPYLSANVWCAARDHG